MIIILTNRRTQPSPLIFRQVLVPPTILSPSRKSNNVAPLAMIWASCTDSLLFRQKPVQDPLKLSMADRSEAFLVGPIAGRPCASRLEGPQDLLGKFYVGITRNISSGGQSYAQWNYQPHNSVQHEPLVGSNRFNRMASPSETLSTRGLAATRLRHVRCQAQTWSTAFAQLKMIMKILLCKTPSSRHAAIRLRPRTLR